MYFDKNICLFRLEVYDQKQLFEIMANRLYEQGIVKETYLAAITDRENKYPTGLLVNDCGFAIPHTDSDKVIQSQICFASLTHPVIFKNMVSKNEEIQVDLVFMLAMKVPHEQVDNLQKLIELFQNRILIEKFKTCTSETVFKKLILEANLK